MVTAHPAPGIWTCKSPEEKGKKKQAGDFYTHNQLREGEKSGPAEAKQKQMDASLKGGGRRVPEKHLIKISSSL